jgi:DNA-directed RNA polymerase I, II, and III subunit RPABC1
MENIIETLNSIARVRGYTDVVEDEDTSKIEFCDAQGTRKLVVLFATGDVGKPDVNPFLATLEEVQATEGILVVPKKITTGAVKEIKRHPIPTQIFLHSELVFDILTHDDCPRYEVVPAEEHAAIFEAFAPAEKLPRLKRDDPVARYMGLQKDAVVKVTFPSSIVVSSVFYQIVV